MPRDPAPTQAVPGKYTHEKESVAFTPRLNHRISQSQLKKCFTLRSKTAALEENRRRLNFWASAKSRASEKILCGGRFLAGLEKARGVQSQNTDAYDPSSCPRHPARTALRFHRSALHGLTITSQDVQEGSAQNASVVTVGTFTIQRPAGGFEWKYGTAGNGERLAMDLYSDHSLTLHSPAAIDNDDTDYAIELKPGPNGGVFFNNARLLSSAEGALAIGGGHLAIGDYAAYNLPWFAGWYAVPGTLAAGSDARAFGAESIALGEGSRAGIHALALGPRAVADYYSTALGEDSFASNHGIAIGALSHARGGYTFAFGVQATSEGMFTMAFGPSYTSGWYSIAMHANAEADSSFAAAWGRTLGVASIDLGGSTEGYKSLAVNSGCAWGDYATAIGRGTEAKQNYQIVLGTFNNAGSPAKIPVPSDILFTLGNGKIDLDNTEHRSNALTVSYEANTRIQGAITVDGEPSIGGVPTGEPATSVFKHNVSVQGVLRVAPAGDLGMEGFSGGPQP